MTRKELITSDEWIKATVNLIINKNKTTSKMRKELREWLIIYRDELLNLK